MKSHEIESLVRFNRECKEAKLPKKMTQSYLKTDTGLRALYSNCAVVSLDLTPTNADKINYGLKHHKEQLIDLNIKGCKELKEEAIEICKYLTFKKTLKNLSFIRVPLPADAIKSLIHLLKCNYLENLNLVNCQLPLEYHSVLRDFNTKINITE